MKRSLKKLSIILAAALVLTSLPVSSFGAEIQTTESENSVSEREAEGNDNGELNAEEPQAPAEENGNLNETAPEEGQVPDENTGEESAPAPAEEAVAPTEETPEIGNEPAENGNTPLQGSEGEQGTGETGNDGQENVQAPEQGENSENNENSETGEGDTVSEDAPEEIATESTGDIEWEDEVDIEDSETKTRKDGEDEDEDEESEEEDSEDDYEFASGNIDMNMDFSEETVEMITSATQERMNVDENGDDMSLSSLRSLDSAFFSINKDDFSPKKEEKENWCWAYAAASMAEINLKHNEIKNRNGDDIVVKAEDIVRTMYNPNRYDYYGETWDKTNDADNFNSSNLTDGKFGRWDYTAYTNTTTDTNSGEKGNLINTIFNFERWGSPVTGSSYEGSTDVLQAQLENAVWVPNNDIDSIKALIRDYGSAGIQIFLKKKSELNYKDGDYYKFTPITGISENETANRTVVLVGWDDNVNVDRFSDSEEKQPGRNGAFLAMNSYTDETKDIQFFWISYEDVAFKLYNGKYKYAVAFDFTAPETNDFTYGYDGTNYYGSFYTKKVYGIFRSSHSGETNSGKVEMLKSIGIGLQDAGKYKLSIYSSFDPTAAQGSQILNEFLVETMTVQIDYPGYHTIELDEPILFYKNDVVSVCFEKYDSTNFDILVDGFDTDKANGGWPVSDKKPVGYYGKSDILIEKGEGYEIKYNSFTHGARDKAECYFITGADTSTPVSGNKVPVPGSNSDYMRIVPRMRLYTSNVKVPSDVDQTMLDIKLEKYIWTYTGNKVNPWPEVMIDFDKTEEGPPEDRGGREYHRGIVMYSVKAKKSKDTITVESEYHYKLTYANNKEAGIAAAIVRGTGDIFSGEISMPFKIEKEQIRIEKCKILGLEPQDYKKVQSGETVNSTYEAIKDNIVVKYYVPETKHYVNLKEGVDYKIGSIQGENAPGKKLTVMVTGIGTFKNTVKKPFKIRKENQDRPISDAAINVDLTYTENGQTSIWKEERMPETYNDDPNDDVHIMWNIMPDVDYSGKKILMKVDKIYDTETGTELIAGQHYKEKITYKGNRSAGMASITIKALKGSGYSGSITRYFMINPMHVTTDATVKFNKTYTYTGDPIKAKPTVKLYGKKMSQKDLCVIYINNTGSSSGEATATGIVFGKGRYTGYIGYGTFTIKPSSSSS